MGDRALLRALHQAGRARWPALAVDAGDFEAHVLRHIPRGADPDAHLRALASEDLYLGCACALGVAGAAEALDREQLASVPRYIAHIDPSPSFADEVQQVLREKLLVGPPPRIAEYAGRGALASWLRVAAVRAALDLRARPDERRRHWDPDAVLGALATSGSPEDALAGARHAADFGRALRRAVASLQPEQRVLLRMYFAGGQSTERIAAALRVNRSTAARRLVAAREAVYEETRRLLYEELRLAPAELASLARAVHGQLDLSLTSLLAEG